MKIAEPNYIRHVLGYVTPGYNAVAQWNLAEIRAPEAWQQYFSATQKPGQGVLVAVLDSGVDVRHPDLAPNIARDASGSVIFLDEVYPNSAATPDIDASGRNYDWTTAYSDAMHPGPDGNGHGTHVAGILAAAGVSGYDGTNIVGVAPDATILPVKVMESDGNGDDWSISNGIVDAANRGARIENLSIGGPMPSDLLSDAITYAVDKGVLLVAAAGETLPTGSPVFYPAAYPGVIAVGAVGQKEDYEPYSNFGTQVALVAPGGPADNEATDGVLSTLPTYGSEMATELPSGIPGYGHASGTSQATPCVAGVAAMIWSLYPNLTAQQVRDRLVTSADKLGGVDFSQQTGWGLVDAMTALSVGDPRYGQ